MQDDKPYTPQLLATTNPLHTDEWVNTSPPPGTRRNETPTGSSHDEGNNYIKSASFSSDGTTVITSSADNVLRSYILYISHFFFSTLATSTND